MILLNNFHNIENSMESLCFCMRSLTLAQTSHEDITRMTDISLIFVT